MQLDQPQLGLTGWTQGSLGCHDIRYNRPHTWLFTNINPPYTYTNEQQSLTHALNATSCRRNTVS